jgi:hypothetical protein
MAGGMKVNAAWAFCATMIACPQPANRQQAAVDLPDAVRTISAAHYRVEQWLPPLAVP